MKTFQRLKDGKNKYLLIPVMPTPNGGLHLGHLSGPYLKMDVLARAQRRNGNETAIFFGSDVYESYMNLKSWQTGEEVEDICNKFHQRMKNDLDALKIEYDGFMNPLDDAYKEDFKTFFRGVVKELISKGVVEVRDEKYLYAEHEDNFLTGCWINGTCPVCGAGTGSYQCEDCGTQYRPMDIINPSFRKGDSPLTPIEDKDLYLIINKKDELLQHLERMNAGDEFIEIAKTYFDRQGKYVRISNPGEWGIPFEIDDSKIPHVLFTYTALYFYSIFCGELYKKKFKLELNPFHKDSEVITVASFGIDCTIPYMVAGIGLGIESGTYRPMDFLLPNHFFTLENSKFSTSRSHAIWGGDIVNKTPVSSDSIRYFLALKNPENEMRDFNVQEFIDFVNKDLAKDLQLALTNVWNIMIAETVSNTDDEFLEKLESLLIAQLDYLTPPGFNLKNSCLSLKEWINYGSKNLDLNLAYWWLKGFALLAFPIMPDCATGIWHLLGHTDLPSEKDYFKQQQMQFQKEFPQYFKAISFEELKAALPATLFANEIKN
ncbi:MAG: class I tRNA ligase family protein [Ginsengibacter sp.]